MRMSVRRYRGIISPVALTRSNRREMTFFVNGRWVLDASLSAALLQAYHTLLMVGRYPLAALFIQIPPEEVDVNVHPAKSEVRFRSSDAIFSSVSRAARRALLAYSPIPSAAPASTWQRPIGHGIDLGWEMAQEAGGEARGMHWDVPSGVGTPTSLDQTPAIGPGAPGEILPPGSIPLLRLVGQVGAAYLVAEGPDGLYLIDQHAAHERVLFERFYQQHGNSLASQALLEPALVILPPSQAAMMQNQQGILEHLGFQVEPFGPNTFRVRAIPAIFSGADPAAVVRVVVEDFEEDETPLQAEVEARLVARICKRSAVKAGQVLSPEEQRALLRDLEGCQSPRTCPHGRPTMIHLSVDMLERQFGRRGAR